MSRCLLFLSLVHASTASVSRESTISDDFIVSYDYNMNNWMSSAIDVASAYSGTNVNKPMDIVSLDNEPNFQGVSQQAMWGLKPR